MKYKVIDNLVPESLANQIETVTCWRDDFSWGYRDQTSGVDDNYDHTNSCIQETYQFQHDVYAHDRGVTSPQFELLSSPMHFLEHHMQSKIEQPQRIKVNMLMKDVEQKGKYHPPHIDLRNNTKAYSMVYYVNDSDGDTKIFDKVFHENPIFLDKLNYGGYKNFELIHSNPPKKGSAIVFASNRFHASSNPVINNRRVIINYVFFASEDFLTKNT
jgi:hypothetical protein